MQRDHVSIHKTLCANVNVSPKSLSNNPIEALFIGNMPSWDTSLVLRRCSVVALRTRAPYLWYHLENNISNNDYHVLLSKRIERWVFAKRSLERAGTNNSRTRTFFKLRMESMDGFQTHSDGGVYSVVIVMALSQGGSFIPSDLSTVFSALVNHVFHFMSTIRCVSLVRNCYWP